jgi:polyisoprenoid-binding protein YceI
MYKLILSTIALGLFAMTNINAAEYEVDTKKTKVKWHAEKVTGEHDGYVSVKSGSLDYSDGELEGGEFVIDMTSIVNTDIEDKGYRAKLENHLKSDDFFAVEKYPEAMFEITEVKTVSGQTTVHGEMTIKGKTNKISFPAEMSASGDALTATATITLDRSNYDVKYRSKSFFDIEALGDKMIYDEFTITLHLVASK